MNSRNSWRQSRRRIRVAALLPAIHAFVVALVLGVALIVAPRTAHADSWALLIGIDQYADSNRITSLGGAAADARALAKTLRESAGFPEDHIQLLVSDGDPATRPTRVEILNALTRLTANAKAGDTVFVLYSGHGIEIDGTSYLLPYDTSALSNADIVDTALETEKFTKRLRLIKAHAVVLAFDMCRSDPRMGARGIGGETDNKLSKAVVRGLEFANAAGTGSAPAENAGGPSIAITLYSCSPNERSYEDRLHSRGYFSEFLEKGLRGAAADASGTVRVAALAKYLEKNVHAAVAEAENGASETPYPEMKGPGVEDFALARRSATAIPALTEKAILRHRAQVGQTMRERVTASLIVAGGDGRLNTTEIDKITFAQIDPQSGEITAKNKTERMTMSSSAGIHDTDIPETASLTTGPDGKLISVKSTQGNPESDTAIARLRQATGVCFPNIPVAPGEKWSHDYDANPALGTRAAHADFEILSSAEVDGVKTYKIRMRYSERGKAPLTSTGTFLIDTASGDVLSGDADVQGVVVAGQVFGGTIHRERIQGEASE